MTYFNNAYTLLCLSWKLKSSLVFIFSISCILYKRHLNYIQKYTIFLKFIIVEFTVK